MGETRDVVVILRLKSNEDLSTIVERVQSGTFYEDGGTMTDVTVQAVEAADYQTITIL